MMNHGFPWISSKVNCCFRLFPAAVSPGGLQTLRLCSTTLQHHHDDTNGKRAAADHHGSSGGG